MKSGITTVAERVATKALLLASDDDSDEEELIPPQIAAKHPEFKLERSVVESDFYSYWVFLEPLAALDDESQETDDDVSAPLAVFRSYGEEITVLQGLDLDLCSRWSAQTGMPINMDALFVLCFVEDVETSNRAMQYFGSLLQRGTPWLCSYDTLLQILQTFGVATQLSTLCEEYNKQSTAGNSFEEPQVRPRLYLCNDAARHMEHVLISVRTSYEMALDRTLVGDVTLVQKNSVLGVFELLLKLNCDATIRERYSGLCASALQAVLDYLRAIETLEWRATPHTPAVSGLSGLPAPAPAPPGVGESEEFRSDLGEEESQLSQQLQDTALSQDAPPVPPPQSFSSATQAQGAAVSAAEKEGAPTEPSWAYDAAYLGSLPDTSMSALLLRRLDSIVACEGLSLYALCSVSGLLTHDPAYLGLWRYFLQSIVCQRIMRYFPDSDGADALTSGTRSLLDVLCDRIEDIQAQERLPFGAERSRAFIRKPGPLRGFFHLVHRFAAVEAPGMSPEEVADLRDVCGRFRRKTGCSEVLDSVDGAMALCDIYMW